jgi:hypothetical protein
MGRRINPYVFISIPRTGTHSVRAALGVRKRGKHNHRPARIMRGRLSRTHWSNSVVFTFVRNPYDRLVSFFRFHKTVYNRMSAARQKHYRGNFHQWVDAGCPHHFRRGLGDPLRMWSYILDAQGNSLVDFVGRTETLSADLVKLGKLLDVTPAAPQRLNPSHRQANYRMYYDAKTRKLAERICERDADLFGYTF